MAFNSLFALDSTHIRDFDEARYGVAASEMLHSHSALVTTYAGEIEYWNLKPALGYWLLEGSFQVFGETPFARDGVRGRFGSERWLLVWCYALIPVLLFTIIRTHHSWYILPTYPAWAMLGAAALVDLYKCESRCTPHPRLEVPARQWRLDSLAAITIDT